MSQTPTEVTEGDVRSGHATRSPLRRWLRRIAIAFGLSAVVFAAFATYALWPQRHVFYTDANQIREAKSTAVLRDVLWEPAEPLETTLALSDQAYEPRLSRDGDVLYFVAGKAGENADIYWSARTHDGWSAPQALAGVNSQYDDLGPEPSPDGRRIYFYSNRPGGQGGYDLWVALAADPDHPQELAEPVNLGPAVNSPFNDYGPAIAPDGTLYFSSNRPQSTDRDLPEPDAWTATIREDLYHRTYDLYSAEMTDAGASQATPVPGLNTIYNEGAPAISPVGDFVYFASDRPGGAGGFDLYRSRRLHGEHLPAQSLGPAVNSPANDLDPALSMAGFALHFSSDRPVPVGTGQVTDSAATYRLFQTTSREVFVDSEMHARGISWGAFWSRFGRNLLWALLALLLLLAILALLRDLQGRTLSLAAKCLLASLLLHCLLLFLLSLWAVTASYIGDSTAGGVRVALAAPAHGESLAGQIRGHFVDGLAVPPLQPTSAARLDTAVPPVVEHRVAELAPTAMLEQPLATAATPLKVSEAASTPRIDPPAVRTAALPFRDSRQVNVSLPAVAAPVADPDPNRPEPSPRLLAVPAKLTLTPLTSTNPEPFDTTEALANADPVAGLMPIVPQPADAELGVAPATFQQFVPNSAVLPMAIDSPALELTIPTNATPSSSVAADESVFEPDPASSLPALSDRAELPAPLVESIAMQVELTPNSAPFPAQTDLSTSAPLPTWEASPAAPPAPLPRAITLAAAIPTELPIPVPAAQPVANPDEPAEAVALLPARSDPLPPPRRPLPAPALDHAALTVDPSAYRPTPEEVTSPSIVLVDASAEPGKSWHPTAPDPLAWSREIATIDLPVPSQSEPHDSIYPQRSPDRRRPLLGDDVDAVENAVRLALQWLADHQSRDGRWDGDEFDSPCGLCGGAAEVDTPVATTGLATLAFLAADHDHLRSGPYRARLQAALDWIRARQDADGAIGADESMYSHAIATLALAEAYGMTGDPLLREPLSKAIVYLNEARTPDGFWAAAPHQPPDTSVFGWVVSACAVARSAGMEISAEITDSASRWLNSVASPSQFGRFSFQPGDTPNPVMTAEALYASQLLGRHPQEPLLRAASLYLQQNPPSWAEEPNTYYWHFASLALHQQQGELWDTWRDRLVPELVENQRRQGSATGSWDPVGRWARPGGRLYQTALCVLTLQTPYRYPLEHDRRQTPDIPADAIGVIRGTVFSAETGRPLPGAAVRLDLHDRPALVATAGPTGQYVLFAPEVPPFFALTATCEDHTPLSRNASSAPLRAPGTNFTEGITVDFVLEPARESVVSIEAVPELHHLGDNRFDGRINSQFQKQAEGDTFSADFELTADQLPPRFTSVELRLLAKGVQYPHRFFINGEELDQALDTAPSDGSFGEFITPFDPALLKEGLNNITIRAGGRPGDVDDFEFVNVQLHLAR